jgi:hypothetical protein
MKRSQLETGALVGVALAMVAASLAGLVFPDFYATRNNSISNEEIRGQDLVSLAIGLALLGAAIRGTHKTPRSFLVAGILVYGAYTYSYFCFGMLINRLFLLDLAIAGASFLLFLKWVLGISTRNRRLPGRYPRKTVSLYLIGISATVGAIELLPLVSQSCGPGIDWSSNNTFVVLDLAFLFPGFFAAAIWNWRQESGGIFLTGAFLVKTIALMPALLISDVLCFFRDGIWVNLGFDLVALAILVSAISVFLLYCRRVPGQGT